MNATSRPTFLSNRRTTFLLSAVLGLVATVLPVVSTSLTPQVEAVANRRICMYNADVDVTVYDRDGDYKAKLYTGVNYKKDGACPKLDPSKLYLGINQTQPVPKIECEKWGEKIGSSRYQWNTAVETTKDPCTRMPKDVVMHFRVRVSDKVANVATASNVANYK
jgi:hypothetical protein